MKFGVGILGATGYIAAPYRAEIRQSSDEARIVALCARRRDLLEAAAREDGAALATGDWRQVVEHPQVNLVVVATPDALHHEAVMACAAAGKHVVCEKPIGMDAPQAFAMWSAYRERGLGHFVPFWTRYVPVFMRARQMVRAGLIGELQSVIYRWHNPRPAAMPFT
jgi:predicted dehydrogenase